MPKKLPLTKEELDIMLQAAQTPLSDSLTGILAAAGDVTAEQIREERLAKYSLLQRQHSRNHARALH